MADKMNELIDEENRLADKLKEDYCDQNGKEKDLAQSSNILHQLGLIYKSKSEFDPVCSGRLCLIQSATLLNAAIVRKPENISDVNNDLQKLCKYVLKKANAEHTDADLVKYSLTVAEKIKCMREDTFTALKDLEQISDNYTGDQLNLLEKSKISKIQNLQKRITEKYTALMNDIGIYCEEVMGQAPCKYSLVGIGSLARKEITPYFDFENIIVLDKTCQNWSNLESVKEYFRWYTVIFQIILINLQETILPSVSISCLNDHYNNGPDWFYDAHTKRGVSFDGMMPHACKSPLGRQVPTEKKNYILELIQPLNEMLKYLTTEESIKNGYHLGDILTKTCFVSGNEQLYNEFKQGVQQKLKTNYDKDNKSEIRSQVQKDLRNFATRSNISDLHSNDSFNVKRVIYRSTTLFIQALASINNVNASSSFDVITDLAKQKVISSYIEHKLNYAVAIACEIRLRVYMKKERQDDTLKNTRSEDGDDINLISTVGKKSIISYFQIVYSLQYEVSNQLKLQSDDLYSYPNLLNASICFYLNLHSDANVMLSKVTKQITDQTKGEYEDMEKCLRQIENSFDGNSYSYIKRIEELGLKSIIKKSEEENARYLAKVGEILQKVGKHEEAVKQFKYNLSLSSNGSRSQGLQNTDQANANYSIGLSLMFIKKYSEAIEYLKKSLAIYESTTNNKDTDKNIADNFYILGSCLRLLNQHDEALIYHQKSLAIRQETTTNKDTDKDIANSFYKIGIGLGLMNQHDEALIYHKKSLAIKQRTTNNEDADKDIANSLYEIGICLGLINQHDEALIYHKKSLAIKQRTTKNEDADKDIANSLYKIGICLRLTNKLDEALIYHENSLAIKQRTTTNEDTDKGIANSFYEIGMCLMLMTKHDEALNFYRKSLAIKQKTTTNEDTDEDIAESFYEIGICLRLMNKHFEALIYHIKSLEIKQNTTTNENTDKGIAKSFYEIGICHRLRKKHSKALDYFKKSLAIGQRTTMNEESDRSIANIYYSISISLQEMNQLSEALKYRNKSLEIEQRTTTNEDTDKSICNSFSQ